MRQVHVAILWHQHQPVYKTSKRVAPLPWVRLHGIKDYIGMGLLAKAHPEMHHVINYVPSLLDQLDLYCNREMSDRWLELTVAPAADLGEEDKLFILDEFFCGTWDKMILPNPRFAELLEKRKMKRKTAQDVAGSFSAQDMRDLQVWSNLAWFHPLVVDQTQELRSLIDKGRDFTELDKQVVVDKQYEVLSQIIPLHRELQDAGSVEISVSPYYHPILPLLCRMEAAHVALPHLSLPDQVDGSWQDDAKWHLAQAVARYRHFFGRDPRGLWPSEGSVSPEIIPLVAGAGIRWFASDEEVLAGSLGQSFSRDEHGTVRPAEMLYTPYRLSADPSGSLYVVFRDHFLSDRIGFDYCRASDPKGAAGDLIARLERVRSNLSTPPLVCIILDGENAWEFYENQGVPFLTALYEGITNSKLLRPTTVSDYLDAFDGQTGLDKLFSGSWIGHNFATWVGHEEKNTAWNLLARARKALLKKQDQMTDEARQKAWRHLHIAEGSDWYWWYGDDHSNIYHNIFDALFRENLRTVYEAVGLTTPMALTVPIFHEKGLYTQPTYLLHNIQIDGHETSFFEWHDAGVYDPLKEESVMHQSTGRAVNRLYFGWDMAEFYIRLDPETSKSGALGADWHCRVVLATENEDYELETAGAINQSSVVAMQMREENELQQIGRFCRSRIVEVAIPWDKLGFTPSMRFSFAVEILRDGKSVQRLPEQTMISCQVPGPDFEASTWMV